MRDALHVIQAVESQAGPANADQLTRFERAAVTPDVESTRSGDGIRGQRHGFELSGHASNSVTVKFEVMKLGAGGVYRHSGTGYDTATGI